MRGNEHFIAYYPPRASQPVARTFFKYLMADVNNNFSVSVVVETDPQELQSRVLLESLRSPRRITALHRLSSGETFTTSANGSELLIVEGECHHDDQYLSSGHYLRIHQSTTISTDSGCIMFEKTDQYLQGDTGKRIIDTTTPRQWLPGPVDGVTICPLHVYDSESIMLLKWNRACEFRPNLDPQGEELLVLSGLLQNRDQLYKPLTWLRNPVEDWHSWHGASDTLVYYKSGHFPRPQ